MFTKILINHVLKIVSWPQLWEYDFAQGLRLCLLDTHLKIPNAPILAKSGQILGLVGQILKL